ncbi:MAG: PAS domain-containing protein [Hoeflea sp.]|uniref:PAS domain-containing protein n=1 Tax=Hoeflea sp. TaxID=1940281 RepID=UPI003EF45A08
MQTENSSLHFDQVDRGFLQQQRDHVGVSGDEIIDLLGSMTPLGIWRLEIETGHVYWSEDSARIHGMEKSDGPVSLSRILASYHPEDAKIIEELMGSATVQRNSFRFVMRVKDSKGSYRLVATGGGFRADNGGELFGFCHEYQDMVRSVVMTGG